MTRVPPSGSAWHLNIDGCGRLTSTDCAALEALSREAEIIVCYHQQHAGVWVQALMSGPVTKNDLRAHKTALEMAVGRARSIFCSLGAPSPDPNPLKVRIADDKQWAFMIGLVACGLAERIQIK